MYNKKQVTGTIDTIKKSISQVEGQLFQTKNKLIQDLDLTKIEEERKYDVVNKRLVELRDKKNNLEGLKTRLNKSVNDINKKVLSQQTAKKQVLDRIKELERERKKLPLIDAGVRHLKSEKAKHERKMNRIRVILDQLTLVIKETRMQEQQLRKLNRKLELTKKRLI